jgi:transcriptional regulator with XRE-family HTH domain
MSLRQIAKELEISPAYLSYMLNGKRPWRKDLYQRYLGVVNTFVNSEVVGEDPVRSLGGNVTFPGREFGAGEAIRTPDILLGKQALYP